MLASLSDDGTVQFISMKPKLGQYVRHNRFHVESADDVVFGDDWRFALISTDNGVEMYHSLDQEPFGIRDTPSSATVLDYNPDAGVLAVGLADSTIQLWDHLSEGPPARFSLASKGVVDHVAISGDGQSLIASASVEAAGHAVRVWRLADGKLLSTFDQHWRGYASAAFSPRGDTIAVSRGRRPVELWSVADGTVLHSFYGDTAWAAPVVFSPDGGILAGVIGGRITLWDVASGEVLHTLELTDNSVRPIAFSPNGSTLASADHHGMVQLWQTKDGTFLGSLSESASGTLVHPVTAAFTPDGETLITCTRDAILVWRLRDGAIAGRFAEGQHPDYRGLAIAPNGKTVAVSQGRGTLQLWELDSGKLVRTIEAHKDPIDAVAFSPDGTILASASYDGSIRLWRVSDGKALEGHSLAVSVAFSPDGSLLLSTGGEGVVRLWGVMDE
jgi:WD40 repeat protein